MFCVNNFFVRQTRADLGTPKLFSSTPFGILGQAFGCTVLFGNIKVLILLPNNGIIGLAGEDGTHAITDESFIFTGRHIWVQKAFQDPISNGGEYFVTHTLIHELGHLLDASHEETYVWKTILGIDQATVMEATYHGSIVSKLEFSSTYYNGDSTHNNALHLRQTKASVSAYS